MPENNKNLFDKFKEYHFEIKHVLVLFIILAAAQVFISLVQRYSLQDFLVQTQESYQKDSAERLANLTATSLELLLETTPQAQAQSEQAVRKIVEALNIILSQQLLLQHVEEACVLVSSGDNVFAIDNGQILYDYFFGNPNPIPPPDMVHEKGVELYQQIRDSLTATEQIQSILEGQQTFHVFVPFVPKGEFAGAVYMKNSPDFDFITSEIISGFNESSLVFTGLILFGLLAMFYISSYTVRERDEANELLFKEREKQIKETLHHQKEALFAKRIYHTHHKAEKVMGFIKDDLRTISAQNIEEIKYRVTKYANFISRVIYDMKWYEPPIQAIRNPIFRTNLNEVIRFIVDNICLRKSKQSSLHKFEFELDERLPVVHVNEFVVWEIIEPLFQNSLDHNVAGEVTITVKTHYCPQSNESHIIIADNGSGIEPELLQEDEAGIKRIFLENISTKLGEHNSGYGCYLAYEIAKQRCGWQLDAENLPAGGCKFTLTIHHG